MNATAKPYNYCLDFLKGIACIFVVFMHCEFPGLTGIGVQAISRFCVPFFFMVSGYYCFQPFKDGEKLLADNKLRIKKKTMHIGKITLYASLFYLAFVLIQQLIIHNQDLSLTIKELIYWIIFNEPKVVAHQYWFLFALLYAYAFYGVLEHFNLRRFEYILAAILFLVYFFLAQGMHIAGFHISNCFYRNWLVEAFPFFMVGHWIHENQEKINTTNRVLLIVIAIFTLTCLLERYLLGRDFGVNICTIPQVFALFVYGVKNPSRHEGLLQRLGRDCSMLVYVFHPAVWHTMDGVYYNRGLSDNLFALYMKPLLVLGFSILLAMMFNYVMALIKKKQPIISS